jgi:hypothetical protein
VFGPFLTILCHFFYITAPRRNRLGKVSLDERVGGSTFFGRKGGGYPLNFDSVRPMLMALSVCTFVKSDTFSLFLDVIEMNIRGCTAGDWPAYVENQLP